MQNENDGCRKKIIAAAVWLSCGFVNTILTALLTGIIGGVVYMIYFSLPLAAMMLTTLLMDVGGAVREVKSMIKKGEDTNSELESSNSLGIPKSYGKAAFPVSIIVFLIGGGLTSFWAESFVRHMAIFAGLGLFWGMVWYQMMQRGYMSHENF